MRVEPSDQAEYRRCLAATRTTETYSEYDTARRPNKTTQVPEQSSNKLGYNSYGRPSTVTLNSVLLSTTGYDANGEVNTVTYNGNGTALTEIGRDSAGRTNKLVYKKVGVLLAQDEITARYPNGRPPVPHRYRPIPLRRPHRSRQRIRLHLPQRPINQTDLTGEFQWDPTVLGCQEIMACISTIAPRILESPEVYACLLAGFASPRRGRM